MAHFEKTTGRTDIFNGKIVRLHVDTVTLENGREVKREVIDHPGGVGILPVDENNHVILVKQFRYPFGRELLEIPAGKLEYGEDHHACGVRELKEETGYRAQVFEYLGCLYPTPAYVTEITHLYYAEQLIKETQHLDENEFLSLVDMPLEQAVRMVFDGEICDAKTQIALLKVWNLKQHQ